MAGRQVVGHSQPCSAAGADEQGGPMKQLEAERLHALQQGHDGVFSGAAPLGGTRLELEVGQQVVREGHELLPGAVGGVGLGRDAVETYASQKKRSASWAFAALG
jgi:hypothetical protein